MCEWSAPGSHFPPLPGSLPWDWGYIYTSPSAHGCSSSLYCQCTCLFQCWLLHMLFTLQNITREKTFFCQRFITADYSSIIGRGIKIRALNWTITSLAMEAMQQKVKHLASSTHTTHFLPSSRGSRTQMSMSIMRSIRIVEIPRHTSYVYCVLILYDIVQSSILLQLWQVYTYSPDLFRRLSMQSYIVGVINALSVDGRI